ncbi:hypothetical protein FS595_10500 [Serratia rubidaea]|uniref:hypothetical protein n=1 Tax=Serratia rubidaea TaxID=61652 RepID=UPI001F3FEB1B|nr:hypothetical protein [Serratia rubidaea]UJD80104.1 hypothetical protein FS596_10500 [Serratia rubidaea]UJD84660.1 hypothetical protein FS595_10500 [Serratia rubidaea]
MSNISSFDEYAGRVFALLYESFPIPLDLTIGDILGQQDMYMQHGIPAEMMTECEIASYTVQWLASAGYLCMQAGNGNDFFHLVLTEKGLEVMKAIPGAIDSQSQPLGKQISAALKTGAKETLKILTNQALAIGVKMAAQKFGL